MTDPSVTRSLKPDIKLLGPVCIDTTRGVVVLGGVKLQVLLAMLAVAPGQVVTNGRLIDALWGQAPPPTADTALRVNVTRLRNVLSSLVPPAPEVVHRPPGYVLLVDGARIDTLRFQAMLSAAADAEPAEALGLLESALSLWRGEPFGGSCDHDVLRVEGERLGELYEVALENRAAVLLALGEHETAISHLEGLVRLQPLRERRTLLLMKALYRAGRQADALVAFQRLRRVLRNELGLSPTPELKAVEQAILAHDISLEPWRTRTSAPSVPAGATPPLPWWLATALNTQMLGREEQIQRLSAVLLDWLTGRAGEAPGACVLLLAGEAGVGKTRLLGECVKYAGSRGARVLAGWCDPGGVMPFRPLMEALREVLAPGNGVHPATSSRTASFVARYLTEGDAGQPRTDPETDRLRFFEAMARLLQDASNTSPVLLAIDDIHWLDPSSSALLRHLLRRQTSHPVMLVGCYRSDPAEHTTAWRQTMAELQQQNACSLVEVAELGPDASARLVTQLARERGIPHPDALSERILPVTGGNPLFIREVMTQLAMDGAGASIADGVPVPPTILSAVANRLTGMSVATQGVLNAAAVIGRRFSLEDAAAVAQCAGEVVVKAVEEARIARLVDEIPDLLDEFAFRHGLLREAVYDLMPRSRRLRLHAGAGAAYEHRGDVSSVLARAFHLLEAVPVCPAETAAQAAIDGADAALGRLAYEEASRLVRRALQVVSMNSGTTKLLRWELLIRLGRARAYRGEDVASDAAFADAAQVARELQDPTRLAVAALGDDLDTRALTPSSARVDLIAEGMRAIGDVATPLRVALASTYVVLGSRTCGASVVRPVAEETLLQARQVGDPLALSKALLAWTVCTGNTVPVTDRLEAATEALLLADRAGHPTRAARARLTRVGYLLRLGRAEEAEEEHGRYRTLAERSAVPRNMWHADVVGAALARMKGNLPVAQGFAERALAVGKRAAIAEAPMAFGAHIFFTHWHRGSLAEVRGAVNAFATSPPYLRLWTLAAALAANADRDERSSRQLLDKFLTTVPALDSGDEFWSNELMLAAQLVWDLRIDGPEVEHLWTRLLPCRGQFDVFGAASGTFGPVDRLLGLLAARQGDHEACHALLSDAWRLCESMQAATWAVWTGKDLAAHLRATGRPGQANQVAATTAAAAVRAGMPTSA